MGISSRPRSGRDLFGNQQQHYHKRIAGPGGCSKKRSMKRQIATSQSQASTGSRAIVKRKRTTADSLSPEKEGGKLKSPTRRRKQKKKNGEEEKKHAERKQVATAEISPDSPPSPSSSDDGTDDEEYSAYEEKRQKKQRQKLKTAARPSATPPPVAAVAVVGPVKADVGQVEKKEGNAELSEKKRGAMKTIHDGTDLGMGAEVEGYPSESGMG